MKQLFISAQGHASAHSTRGVETHTTTLFAQFEIIWASDQTVRQHQYQRKLPEPYQWPEWKAHDTQLSQLLSPTTVQHCLRAWRSFSRATHFRTWLVRR